MCLRVTRGRAGCKDWVVKLFKPSTMQKTRVIICPVMIDRFILTSTFFSFTVLAQPVITSPSPVFSTCVKVDLALTKPDAKRPRSGENSGAHFRQNSASASLLMEVCSMKRILRGAFFLIALFASILGFGTSPEAWSDRACHERNRSSI